MTYPIANPVMNGLMGARHAQFVEAGLLFGGVAGGTANALTVSTGKNLTGLMANQVIGLKTGASANSGTATLNVDGLGAKAIQRNGSALTGGELPASTNVWLQFDGIAWQIMGGGTGGSSGALWCGVATGTPNALTLTPATALASYANGTAISFVTGTLDSSAAVTVAVSGLSAVSLLSVSGYALNAGDLKANTLYQATYYSGAFRLQNSTASGSITTAGLLSRIDAGDSACYSSGQTLNNLFATPADGSAAAAYSWVRGASTSAASDDPAFNGTPGGLSYNEYFSVDGGDFSSLAAASNTAFVDSLHKSGAIGTIAAWIYFGGDTPIFGTGDSNAKPYFYFRANPASNYLMLVQANSASGATVVQSSSCPATGGWAFVAASFAEGVSNGSFFYANGGYSQVSASNTFTLNFTSPTSTTAGRKAALLDYGVGSGFAAASGTRLAQAFLWNRALAKSELDATFNATRSRYGV